MRRPRNAKGEDKERMPVSRISKIKPETSDWQKANRAGCSQETCIGHAWSGPSQLQTTLQGTDEYFGRGLSGCTRRLLQTLNTEAQYRGHN